METLKGVKTAVISHLTRLYDLVIKLYYYLVNVLICLPLSKFKRHDGSLLITANSITIARVVLFIPPAIYFSLTDAILAAIILLTCSYIGDTADGEYARNFDRITDLGALLDRAFDKIGNLLVVFSILALGTVDFVNDHSSIKHALIIMSLIEVFALFYSIVIEWPQIKRPRGTDVKSKGIGKFKMAVQSIVLIAIFASEIGLPLNETTLLLTIVTVSGMALKSFAAHASQHFWKAVK